MKEIQGQKLCRLCVAFLVINVLVLGFLGESLSQGGSGPTTPRGGNEAKKAETQVPKGQVFYRWTDEAGHLYLTDDLEKIPRPFREKVEVLELLPLEERMESPEKQKEPERQEAPAPPAPIVTETERENEPHDTILREPDIYKEVPFDKFIRIQVGMDEAEVLSRLGCPSLVTPSDYFYGDRGKYGSQIIRLIYLGNWNLNQKTTVVEIRDGRVVNIKRIFPF
jgi:hypothetical protein